MTDVYKADRIDKQSAEWWNSGICYIAITFENTKL